MTRARWPSIDFGGRRYPKIIEGVLELMPMGPPWDQAQYEEWIALFDQACRIYYRLEKAPDAAPRGEGDDRSM